MRDVLFWITCGIGLAAPGCASVESSDRLTNLGRSEVTWYLDNLASIGGYDVEIAGEPVVINTRAGKAIEFDGVDDGIFLNVNPVAGFTTFTVEVVFMPYRDGAAEQRFFHMQESDSDDRVMFETRLVDNESWFLDTFIKSGSQRVTLYASEHRHELDRWHHAAIVVNGESFEHFVNGRSEIREEIQFAVQRPGRMSLGVRLNKVHWFRGAIRSIRITARPLAPSEFLSVTDRRPISR